MVYPSTRRSTPSRSGSRLELRGLSKRYGPVVAARDIDLTIEADEFLTFLGPSGSGKTTVLLSIAGLVVPSDGDILINDESIVRVPVHQRNIGMVFQNYALFPHLNVAENIGFPLRMRGLERSEIRRRVGDALELVQLTGLDERRPKQLSGGQQQRVALARALVFEPTVLLLDEPLGALDAKLREEMKFELKRLHHAIGTTVLFVTHDQEEALTLSDRVAVFNEGQLVQVGAPNQLYRRPDNRFVADFIGETNLITGRMVGALDGVCRLDLGDGFEMRGALREDFPPPTEWATYTLRLENVTIGERAGGCANVFEGTVEEYLYVGDTTKYLIRISPDWSIRVKVPERGGDALMGSGTKVTVGWDESDALLIESDAAFAGLQST